ncbi:hypothetical protein Lesp01_27500 [Lentzea sp. NBRC 102530]|nr:hypothetical protein Lesp01_27500 [Lentzea sp. NBRC 102530]
MGPRWVTETSARRHSPSTRNVARSASPSHAGSAEGVKPSQNDLDVASDQGP